MKARIYHFDDCDLTLSIFPVCFDENKYEIFSINPLRENLFTPKSLVDFFPEISNSQMVVTDYNMSVFNGFNLAHYLRIIGYKNPIYCFSSEKFETKIIDQFLKLDVCLFSKPEIMSLKENIESKLNLNK